MKIETYEHIEKFINLLDIDYENGLILNRKPQNVQGYVKIKLKQKMIGIHQIISYLKYGKQNLGLVVNHMDGNKLNNNPANLEIVTQQENAIHAFKIGLRKPYRPKGTQHANSILTDDDVREIRELLKTDMMIKDISKKFNIHYTVISKIKSGERWKHVI
jgi:hypothetical protein